MILWVKTIWSKPDTRIWKESFKSYEDGKLKYITYYCWQTNEFKREYPQEEERKKKTVSKESVLNVERTVYAKDLLQPFKPDGTVNPDYVKAYKIDPRKDEVHRNNPRNINNRHAIENYKANEDFRKWEKKKYGI